MDTSPSFIHLPRLERPLELSDRISVFELAHIGFKPIDSGASYQPGPALFYVFGILSGYEGQETAADSLVTISARNSWEMSDGLWITATTFSLIETSAIDTYNKRRTYQPGEVVFREALDGELESY